MKQITGTFYGIGVGPGDPELLTLKAVKTIESSDIIIVPRSEKKENSRAFTIARPYIKEETQIVYQVFPMIYKQDVLEKAWSDNRDQIITFLQAGKNVSFLTLGDPMVYSTYIYLFQLLKKEHQNIVTIPGITSGCDIAAKTGIPLALWKECLEILPATVDEKILKEKIYSASNLVLMKVNSKFSKIRDWILASEQITHAVLVSHSGMEDEKIYYDLNEVDAEKLDYLSTIVLRKN